MGALVVCMLWCMRVDAQNNDSDITVLNDSIQQIINRDLACLPEDIKEQLARASYNAAKEREVIKALILDGALPEDIEKERLRPLSDAMVRYESVVRENSAFATETRRQLLMTGNSLRDRLLEREKEYRRRLFEKRR